jgi:signal transduction histidine kinase
VGGTRPAETGIDLNRVVAEVVDTLQPVMDARGGRVQVVEPLPSVTGDATLIGIALGNLISNGLKFNRRTRPQVEVGCLPTVPATIYVRDNGIGIDPRHHEAVFTIFRRLHGRRQYEGSGVGLTVVRKIVEAHGGRVWLESTVGEGTTFYLTLGSGHQAPDGAVPAHASRPRPPHWKARAHARKRARKRRKHSRATPKSGRRTG